MLFGTADVKDSAYLTAPVEAKAASFGMYTSDVARVSVQTSGGPRRDAIMRDGYWFLPGDEVNSGAMALRGYDADDELIYDSTQDAAECHTDPSGTEILRPGSDEVFSPEDCRPMLVWEH